MTKVVLATIVAKTNAGSLLLLPMVHRARKTGRNSRTKAHEMKLIARTRCVRGGSHGRGARWSSHQSSSDEIAYPIGAHVEAARQPAKAIGQIKPTNPNA